MSTSHTPLYRDTPLILSVSGVTKAFDGFKAIDDLNFYLEEGELRTIIGPNGAGKTTTIKVLIGSLRPSEGDIRVAGFKIPSEFESVKQQFGYVPDTENHIEEFICYGKESKGTKTMCKTFM